MDFLKKNWPLLLIPIIGIILYLLLRNFNKSSAGADDSNTTNLTSNTDAFKAWGCTIDMNTSRNQFTVKGQGNGNSFNNIWDLTELREIWVNQVVGPAMASQSANWNLAINNNNLNGTYGEVILVSEYSSDDDFFMAVYLAGEIGTNILYLYAGVYDPTTGQPNPPVSTNAKAALRLDGLASDNPANRIITILKEPTGKFGLS